MKIGLQIALIEVYFFGFLFDLRSAFKGRFRSILATICYQSCLNMIATESRMQGDHEELKIFLQNCFISSLFNQKLSLQREEHLFIRKLMQKTRAVQFAEEILEGHDRAKMMAHDPAIPRLSLVQSPPESPYEATCRSMSCRKRD